MIKREFLKWQEESDHYLQGEPHKVIRIFSRNTYRPERGSMTYSKC